MFENLPERTAVFFSGGLDSTLLVAMLLEENAKFDIVQFRDHWTKEQRKRVDEIVKKFDLTLFSYPPAATNLIGDGDQIAIVQEYVTKGGTVPLIMDVIDGTKCIFQIQGLTMTTMPIDWTLILTGGRKTDTHWAMPTPVLAERWTIGETEFWAPLYNFTRQDVKRELKIRGLNVDEATDKTDTGNLQCCSLCIQGTEPVLCPLTNEFIPSIQWDREANLKAFHAAYGIADNLRVSS